MTSKQRVNAAINFGYPDRVPLFIFDKDRLRTDVIQVNVEQFYMGTGGDETEWGFVWAKAQGDETSMGVPVGAPLKNWDDFDQYVKTQAPDPFRSDRFYEADAADKGDKYFMGSLYLSGFTIMAFLRGFNDLMTDLYEAPERVEKLADLVFGIENRIIEQMPAHGFDAVSFWDDWGMQQGMMISPEMWRKFFLPRYIEQFKLVHSLGMDVFYHTCGDVRPIIGDLIDAGVDILNLGQPDVNDIDQTGRLYKGKVCFCPPINYQHTGLTGTREMIFTEAQQYYESYADQSGGLLAYIIDYKSMGMSDENYECSIEAFLRLK